MKITSNILLVNVLFVLTLAFTGCAVPYKPPQSGSIARITYTMDDNVRSVDLINYKNPDCSNPIRIEILGRGTNPENRSKTITIPANLPFITHFVQSQAMYTSIRSCRITTTFTPKKDQEYLAVFKSAPYLTSCSAKIFKYSDTGNQTRIIPENTFTKSKKQCSW